MKKALAAILALLMCLACAGCQAEYPYYDMEIEDNGSTAAMRYIWFEELSALEDYAPIMVQGFVLDDAKPITLVDDPIFSHYATQMTLHITKIYKGDFKAGDEIPMIEHWYIREESGNSELRIEGGYMPSDPDTEYLFFLNDAGYDLVDTYTTVDDEVGRFPVPDASADPACVTERDVYRTYIPEAYERIYAEIIEKYF